MIWDKAAKVYDFLETLYNRQVYIGTGLVVASLIRREDRALECACGTGSISRYITPKCKRLVVSDFSIGMLRQVKKNCAQC